MFIAGRPVIWAAQLLLTLFVASSAHPTNPRLSRQTTDSLTHTTLGLDNETLIRLPHDTPWSPEIPVSQASLPYLVPDTAITPNFTFFGPSIPVLLALSTFYDARQQVQSHLASSPNDTINEDGFSYSTHSNSPTSRVCSIVIQAHHNHSLSWSQLDQTLAGLTQFSSGASTDHQFHYQTLTFSIITALSTAKIATGLLSCPRTLDPPPTAPSKKRATPNIAPQHLPQPPLLLSPPTNLTSPPSLPVPGTTITLTFLWLGPPIPPTTINSALHGAFVNITPHLTALSLTKPIPDNKFIYSEVAPAGLKMETVVQIYGNGGGMLMTWARVNAVVAGLYRFANGIGTVHGREFYRCLEFEVWDGEGVGDGGGKGVLIGYGNLLEVW